LCSFIFVVVVVVGAADNKQAASKKTKKPLNRSKYASLSHFNSNFYFIFITKFVGKQKWEMPKDGKTFLFIEKQP
jgi:hypothetical protein